MPSLKMLLPSLERILPPPLSPARAEGENLRTVLILLSWMFIALLAHRGSHGSACSSKPKITTSRRGSSATAQHGPPLGILVGFTVATTVMNLGYFMVFWNRIYFPRRRSAISLALTSINLVMASVLKSVCGRLSLSPGDLRQRLDAYPEMTSIAIDEEWNDYREYFVDQSSHLFTCAICFAAIQTLSVSFWLRFLPNTTQYPDRYCPVVYEKDKNSLFKTCHRRLRGEERVPLASVPVPGALASLFEELERARDQTQTTRSDVSFLDRS